MKRWSNINALYQIYPRSFYDATGDGIGDLKGISEKLDYLKGTSQSLNIDAIWISPFYPSPMADFGYDITNYCDVHPMFGTLTDFKELLHGAHQRDIKVMIDLVPNHTSDQHPWFLSSRETNDSEQRNYYVWRDAKPDGSPPNNWRSVFGGPAWQWDEQSQQYYLHTFLKEQPDLNWQHTRLRQEMQAVLRFWLDMGVDGFRVDAVRYIAKDPLLRDDQVNPAYVSGDPYHGLLHDRSQYDPKLFDYLRELTAVVNEYDDRIMIFEDYPEESRSIAEQYRSFYDISPGIGMPFNFQGLSALWDASTFGTFVQDFQALLHDDEMPIYCFGNHDQPRIATRFGLEQARLIALFQLTLPGIPVVYQGEELGMENAVINMADIQDPVGKARPDLGLGRDPQRSPMQWSDDTYAGFSAVQPWLPLSEQFATSNVKVEAVDKDSFLMLYRSLLSLRKDTRVLSEGIFHLVSNGIDEILQYERILDGTTYHVALNFGSEAADVQLRQSGKILCATHPTQFPEINQNGLITLAPYNGVLIQFDN